jgi:hypothetical protein
MCTRERSLQALDIVEVALDHLRTGCSQRFRFVLARVTRNGSARETAGGIRQNGAAKATALRTCRAHYSDDFLVGHVKFLSEKSGEKREA